ELFRNRTDFLRFAGIALQLALLVAVIQQFHLENPITARTIMPLTLYGFIIHWFLPHRLRLPFFVALSFGGILGALGLANGAILIGLGLGLIALCHVPAPFFVRLLLVLGAAGALAAVRSGWIAVEWGGVVVPVLASLFMFRLIVYMYDLCHGNAPFTPARALAYFFLLPNVVFPLFPAVDYAGFCVTYYNENAYRIYQRGLRWMLRGVLHLILYRFVNYYLVLGPEEIASGFDLLRYVLANFLLYLKVSGQFHLIVGMLLLFGFNLPETHHLYYLASSFSDFWRRINIYWKDFMQKLFFMPLFFRLKKHGMLPAIIISTLVTFIITWFFHAYQWFWLRGTHLFTAPDILFWTILAVFVVVNSILENRQGRKRTLGNQAPAPRELFITALKTTATFTVICTLWSLWISSTMAEWFSIWTNANLTPTSYAMAGGGFLAVTLLLWGGFLIRRGVPGESTGKLNPPPPPFRTMAVTAVGIAALFLLAQPNLYFRLDPRVSEIVRDLRSDKLSKRDAALLERGYYENLTVVNRFNSELWEVYMQRPADWKLLQESDAIQETDDFLHHRLKPSLDMIFKEAPLRTNSRGMRDEEYPVEKPAGTLRIALVGGSHSMGSGVADDETFEALLEVRLDAASAGRVEILNFAVGGYGDLHGPYILENEALQFAPDVVLYVGHPRNDVRLVHHLAVRVERGTELPYPELRAFAERAGVEPGMALPQIENRLRPLAEEITAWALGTMVRRSRDAGAVPVWICIPAEAGQQEMGDVETLVRLARDAGFVTLDLTGIYGDESPDVLRVAPWDMHPNALGHRMLADGIEAALRDNVEALRQNP
ncbi:MAG: hypothetical protein HKN12_01245, partial [Gemmatimonadetes bacterium]|nr:hypothetical protein [Gemmatimonadota bacterium]